VTIYCAVGEPIVSDDRPIGERVAVTENEIKALNHRLDKIDQELRYLIRSAWLLVVAILGWASIQLYSDIQSGIAHAADRVVTATVHK
jgi:hypothetical protein